MTPHHHPSDAALAAYVAATADDARDLVVATHLSLCAACRAHVDALEAVGGALLDDLQPAAGPVDDDDALAALFSAVPSPPKPPAPKGPAWLPEPLRSRVGPLDDDRWQRLVPGVIVQVPLDGEPDGPTLRLVRMRPGVTVPQHGHQGDEWNLVLQGGFSQGGEHYERGDLAQADADVEHALHVAPGEDCVVLQILDGPVVPKTVLGRIVGALTGES